MAKTVDNFSTIEDFRKTYNELAFDVGDISGLRDALKSGSNDTLVDAVNVLEDKQFFFQEFVYAVGTGGVTAGQASFSGADAFGNSLIYKDEKIQVFKNEDHLRENVDYIVSGPTGTGSFETIVLQGDYANGQSKQMAAGDQLIIYSFTGAFIGTNIQGEVASFFQKTAENTINNTNANGVILNGDNSSATTSLESGFTLQLAGRTFAEDDIISTVSGKKVQFPIITDGTAELSSGSLTSAVNGTFSGTVQAEQLTTTDDLTVGDGAAISGDLAVLGNSALFGSANQIGNSSSDVLEIQGDLNMTSAVITSNFLPKVNNNVTLGSSSKKWSNVHSTTFTGNLTGNVTGDVLSTGGQTILDSGTDGTNATIRLSTITDDGSTTVLDVATGALTGTVSSLSNHNTGGLTEGSNLYFTNARADARADIRIGAANIGDLANVTTSSLTNGDVLEYNGSVFANTNLEEKVEDIINGALVGGTNITVTYNDGAGTITIDNDNTADITSVGAGDGLSHASGDGTSGDVTLNVNVDDSTIEIDSDTLQVKSNGITSSHLANNSVGTTEIANNAVTNDKIENSSISIDGQTIALGGTVTNKFFTDARADARIALANISDLNDVGSTSGANSGQILVFDSNGDLQVANNSTGTDSISEEGNKYFTDDRVAQIFKLDDNADGGDDTELNGGILLSYDDNDGGSDTSLDGRITVGLQVGSLGGLSIPTSGSDANKVQLDYSVITSSDLSGGLPDGSGKDVGHLFFLI